MSSFVCHVQGTIAKLVFSDSCLPFSSESFMVVWHVFMNLVHFSLIFIYGFRDRSNLTLLTMETQFFQHRLLKRLPSLYWICEKSYLTVYVQVYFQLSVSGLWAACVSLCHCCTVLMIVPLQGLEPRLWVFQQSLVEEAIFSIDQIIIFNSFIFFRLFKIFLTYSSITKSCIFPRSLLFVFIKRNLHMLNQ